MPRKKKEKARFKIVRDTREQQGYLFSEDPQYCAGMEIRKLDTGDYSLDGYENLVCIERKASTGELAGNLSEGRFDREIQRMPAYSHRFMVFEFSLNDVLTFPVNSGIPEDKWPKLRISSKYMLRRIVEMQMAGVQVVFCDNKIRARHFTWYLLKRLFEEVNQCPES